MHPTFDLQSHSLCSDGELSPAEVVASAAAAGVERLALTDHDSVAGVTEALAAAGKHGITVVPGSEISALDGPSEDLHICAYLVDHTSKPFRATLREFREDRNARGLRMLEALEESGFALERTEVDARRREGSPVGRPHLARAVYDHPDNKARLEEEGLTDVGQVLVAYLIPGTPAYRRRTRPTVQEAIDAIHAAGGLAVWAHPFWDIDSDEAVLDTVDRFSALGLDGVECFYATHTEAQTRLIAGHCESRGMLTTGSADFHGPDHPRFHAFRAFETYDLIPRLGPIAGLSDQRG